jgi:hypothetical protein
VERREINDGSGGRNHPASFENFAITGILRDMPYPAIPDSGALDDAHSFISGLNSTSV